MWCVWLAWRAGGHARHSVVWCSRWARSDARAPPFSFCCCRRRCRYRRYQSCVGVRASRWRDRKAQRRPRSCTRGRACRTSPRLRKSRPRTPCRRLPRRPSGATSASSTTPGGAPRRPPPRLSAPPPLRHRSIAASYAQRRPPRRSAHAHVAQPNLPLVGVARRPRRTPTRRPGDGLPDMVSMDVCLGDT